MARKRNLTPSYLPHASGGVRAAWTDATGIRHFRMIPVPHGSEESRAAHAALALELASGPVATVGDDTTVNELCDAPHPRR